MKTNNERWAIIDVNGVAHRYWHGTPQKTSVFPSENNVIFGVLRSLADVIQFTGVSRLAFCFDQGPLLRNTLFPNYKAGRDRTGKENLYRQIDLLQSTILAELGFRNIFMTEGYEADDWLAMLAQSMLETVVLVTRDHDMLQCITRDGRVTVFDPQSKIHTNWHDVEVRYHVTPAQIPQLMALTGCPGDNVPGIRGVGPITAAKIVTGCVLQPAIFQEWQAFVASGDYVRNLTLVTLPWSGLTLRALQSDNCTQEKWNAVCAKYEMPNLVQHCPFAFQQ